MQLPDGLCRANLDRIGHSHQSCDFAIDGDDHGRLTLLFQRNQLLLQSIIGDRTLAQETTSTDEDHMSLYRCFQTATANFRKFLRENIKCHPTSFCPLNYSS